MTASFWTPERMDTLKAMLAEGKSASQIGVRLGTSRNAVIGQIYRKELAGTRPGRTPEREALLRKLHAEKLSVNAMGQQLGISGAAVHKWCRKLGLLLAPPPGRGNPSRGRKDGNAGGIGIKLKSGTFGQKKTAKPPKAKPVASPPPEEPKGMEVRLADARPTHCRWVKGEASGPDTIYCGAMRDLGASFCSYHQRIAYQPRQAREAKAA